MSRPVVTTPGMYDLPPDVYHADPAPGGSLSSTGARMLLPPSCPALFHHHRQHGQIPKAAFDLGHAAHKLVLGTGPPLVMVDADDWRGKQAQTQRREAHAAGAVPLLAVQHDQVLAMAAAIRAHPVAGVLFQPGVGYPERSAFWVDPQFGVWRRAMLDWWPRPRSGRLIIADYKTAKSSEPAAVARAITEHAYHQQGAWYIDAVQAVDPAATGRGVVFLLVFQEKTPPYLVTVAQPTPETIQWGRVLNQRALSVYRRCLNTGRWQDYTDGKVISVPLPAYYERRLAAAWDRGALEPIDTSDTTAEEPIAS